MDEIEQAKKALEDMNTFMREQIRGGHLKNVGFTDGHSEEYKFHDLSIVQTKNPPIGTLIETVFYDGSEEVASIYHASKTTSLDNENMDEIEAVINLHDSIKSEMDVVKQLQSKVAKTNQVKISKKISPK